MADLHIFDMDHTLIESDCDVTWKEFLVAERLAPESDLREAERFFDQYNRGCMDQDEFNAFQLREFIGRTPGEMTELCRRHFEIVIRPQVRPAAEAFVRACRESGTPCVILSSTNCWIVAPVAEYFGIADFYGTQLELDGGRFTGRIAGDYLAGAGKVRSLHRICRKYGVTPEATAAYGDSINDAELLRSVGFPTAVSPSPALRTLAERNKWRILDWRT